ncbi:MAG TPA: hypothetical protein VLZ75_12740 [Chitinophagales bacterium]|nr:hypothetical protein [Chitinophagales bacterium]
MKKRIALFFAFTIIFQLGYANGILKNSSTIPVKNVVKIDSENFDKIYEFIVSKDIKDVNGTVLISEGSPVMVDIKIKNRKAVGRSGEIKVNLQSVEAVDGQVIELIGGTTVNPEDIKGKVLGIGLGVGLLLVWPMLLYLLKKGEAAVLDSNTTIIGKPIMDYNIQ